jgi:hypothetical protein
MISLLYYNNFSVSLDETWSYLYPVLDMFFRYVDKVDVASLHLPTDDVLATDAGAVMIINECSYICLFGSRGMLCICISLHGGIRTNESGCV